MDKISVIIPTFNCAVFLSEAIDSVLAQTRQVNEVLVIDDGSTDNTQALVATYSQPFIKYFKQKNAGVSAARNFGLQLAQGDFIAFLDADDRWHPEMIERQYKTLSKNRQLTLTFTNFVRFDDPPSSACYPDQFTFYPELGAINAEQTADPNIKIVSGDAFSQMVMFGEIPGYTQVLMLNAGKVKGLIFNSSLKICEDAEFFLRCAARGSLAFDSSILAEVRRHQNNATANSSLIAVNKLICFLQLREFNELNEQQRQSLEKRILKAYWSAANALASVGRSAESWTYVKAALKLPYNPLAKIKYAGRWLLTLLGF